MSLELDSPPESLPGIGPARSQRLSEAGISSVGDLLFHIPFRYEDRRRVVEVAAVSRAGHIGVRVRLENVKTVRIWRRRMTMVRAQAVDETGVLDAVWFNQPYLARRIKEDCEYLLYGEVRERKDRLELVNPSCEEVESALRGGQVVPVYPSVGGLGTVTLRRLLAAALEAVDLEQLEDRIPLELRERYGLPPVGLALQTVHQPPDSADVERLNAGEDPARHRLVYGELLRLQARLARSRAARKRVSKSHEMTGRPRLSRLFGDLVPFELTKAQARVVEEIIDDLFDPSPMRRLLQGDVGSGKTIVALLAIVAALESGLQAALMVPTELLAEQHCRSIQALLGDRYRLALLSRSASGGAEAREALANGTAQLAIGTHALIQDQVSFDRLGLVVIDEQHRFGVGQRQKLRRKGEQPDVLVMTATPIPRSLALTAYGDLDVSVLDELPPGRQAVTTEVVAASCREGVYLRLKEAVEAGGQAYVVFPLIEESEQVQAGAVTRQGEKVREWLGDVEVAILHGRVEAEVREQIMKDFAAGRIRVLIATTVIEVGVDVAAANVMIIESAERFGLAQLHQLRGRVGRGGTASWCAAVHGTLSDEGEMRLAAFEETTDGFRLAETDLALRGPGELLGVRQAGQPFLRLADLRRDGQWLDRARNDALELVERSSEAVEGSAGQSS